MSVLHINLENDHLPLFCMILDSYFDQNTKYVFENKGFRKICEVGKGGYYTTRNIVIVLLGLTMDHACNLNRGNKYMQYFSVKYLVESSTWKTEEEMVE